MRLAEKTELTHQSPHLGVLVSREVSHGLAAERLNHRPLAASTVLTPWGKARDPSSRASVSSIQWDERCNEGRCVGSTYSGRERSGIYSGPRPFPGTSP